MRLFGMATTYLDAARKARDMLIALETDERRAGGQAVSSIDAAGRTPLAIGDPLRQT